MNEYMNMNTFKAMMERYELSFNGDRYMLLNGTVSFCYMYKWCKSVYTIGDLYVAYLAGESSFIAIPKSRRNHA